MPCAAHPISNPRVRGGTAASSHLISSFVDVLRLIGPNLRSLSLGPQSGFEADALSSDPRTERFDLDQEISLSNYAMILPSLTPNLESLELTSYPFSHFICSLSTHNRSSPPTFTSRLPHTLKELSLRFCTPSSYSPSVYASSLADLCAAVETAVNVIALKRVVSGIPSAMLRTSDIRQGLRDFMVVCA